MNSAGKWCAILCLATSVVAQTSTPPKPKKARAAATASEVQALKEAVAAQQAALAAQQQEIQALRDELHHKDQAVSQVQATAADAAAKADAAQVSSSKQQATVTELKNDVTDLKTNVNNTALSLQETQKNVKAEIESPIALHYKGITITPGGFAAAEFVRRSRALGSDINTPFNSLTLPGASQNALTEFFGSGRQSRISALAEGRLASAKLSGYVETDFLSAAVTSNNNESNSYSLRQRQAWGQAAFDNGFSFTGGQMWSLATETLHGVDNRTEAVPLTIDPQYSVGFSWARQYGLRVAKNFGNKVWLAASMENAQATISSHNNADNFLVGSAGAAGGLYNAAVSTCSTSSTGVTTCSPIANYSFNPSPDIIAKAVFEPGFGHYEVFGIYSRFRDRVFPCGEVASSTTLCGGSTTAGPNALGASNVSNNGGGVGANARWTFMDKHMVFGLHGLTGRGIGRYGSGGLPDAAVYANGGLDLIRSYQGLATVEFHNKKLDVYLDAGGEYAGRAAGYDPIENKFIGYGNPNLSNKGCYTETPPIVGSGFIPGSLGGCTGDTRVVMEGTIGYWYRLYTGPKGRFQYGIQYSYVARDTWDGTGFTKGMSVSPSGLDNMVFTSFRYYLP